MILATMSSITEFSVQQLRQAADLKEKIAVLEKELNQVLGSTAKPAAASPAPKKKGGMSAAGKAKIAAAQKARWAKIKETKPAIKTAVTAKLAKKKFTMTAAAKAKISAAAKARWAKIKGSKPAVKAAISPAPKKGGMSAAAKAKISAAAKARWAKAKAAGKKSL